MTQFIPVAGGTLPGDPMWINLDNVTRVGVLKNQYAVNGWDLTVEFSGGTAYKQPYDTEDAAVAAMKAVLAA